MSKNLNTVHDGCDNLDDDLFDLEIPKMEAKYYYQGLRGYRTFGPKLVYRTSPDIFFGPRGDHERFSEIQLLTVHDHDKLSKDKLWGKVRDETADILDRHTIKFTSIDLVRFRREKLDGYGATAGNLISAVTIWIGVYPHSTKTITAYHSTVDILQMLEGYSIKDMDIAFRESLTRPLATCPGPTLYAPVDDTHLFAGIIDRLTTTLGLPIAGLKTPQVQGTIGFYFKVGEDLYGVTSRHALFPPTKDNIAPASTTQQRKYVILMGTQAFNDLLDVVKERKYANYTSVELENLLETIEKDWSDVKNRIIGHVVWSPPISGLNELGGQNGYMRDVCVIKLYKNKFLPNLRGNAISIGKEFGSQNSLGKGFIFGEFLAKLYPRANVPSDFEYPLIDCLYPVNSIIPAASFKKSNIKDRDGDPTRFVFKGGPYPTLGRLNGFLSRTRRYTTSGTFDSIDAAVFPYEKSSDTFSQAGDSGAAIVGSKNEFVAQITAGTGSSEFCDITYGTPIRWLWENVIKPEFPDAVLFFDTPPES